MTADWLLSGSLPSAEILDLTSNLSDRLFSEEKMATYIGAYCNAKHLYETRRALACAKDKHSRQFRKKGHGDERVPYIYHPLLLTKWDGFEKTDRDETLYYNGIAGNRIAAVVKLLDRCHNISSMASCFSDEHMAEYIKETQEYIYPLMEKAREAYPEYSNQLFLIR